MTTKSRSRFRRWCRCTALVALSLGVTLAALEGFARWCDPYGIHYPHEIARYRSELMVPLVFGADGRVDHSTLDGPLFHHRPNARVRFREFEVRTNALGLRGPEIALQKPAGTERIVVLGDSVVFGWGVDDRDTFVRRLEDELNARYPERCFEVVNGGHLMYDTVQESALFRDRLVHLDPDLVLLVYVVNDIEPTRKLLEEFDRWQTAASTDPVREPSWVERLVGLWNQSTWASRAMLGHMLERVRLLHADHGAAPADGPSPEERGAGVEGWERSRAALLEIRDLCRSRGIPFHLFDHCLPRIRALEPFCRSAGIPYHDLRFTRAELRRPIVNSAIDAHANRLGNELLLRKLQRGLATAGLYAFSDP